MAAKPARLLITQMQSFYVYRPDVESISKEMNTGDLNLHSMTKLSALHRHCPPVKTGSYIHNSYFCADMCRRKNVSSQSIRDL